MLDQPFLLPPPRTSEEMRTRMEMELRMQMAVVNMLNLPQRVVGNITKFGMDQLAQRHPGLHALISTVGEGIQKGIQKVIPESVKQKAIEARKGIQDHLIKEYHITGEEADYFLDSCTELVSFAVCTGAGALAKAGGKGLIKTSQKIYVAAQDKLNFIEGSKFAAGSRHPLILPSGLMNVEFYFGKKQKLTVYITKLEGLEGGRLNPEYFKPGIASLQALEYIQEIAVKFGAKKLNIEFVIGNHELYQLINRRCQRILGTPACGNPYVKTFAIPLKKLKTSPLLTNKDLLPLAIFGMSVAGVARHDSKGVTYEGGRVTEFSFKNKMWNLFPNLSLFPKAGACEPGNDPTIFYIPEKSKPTSSLSGPKLPAFDSSLSTLAARKVSVIPTPLQALRADQVDQNAQSGDTTHKTSSLLTASETLAPLVQKLGTFLETDPSTIDPEDLNKHIGDLEQFSLQTKEPEKEVEEQAENPKLWTNTLKVAIAFVEGIVDYYTEKVRDKETNRQIKGMAEHFREEHAQMRDFLERQQIGTAHIQTHYHSPSEYFTNFRQVAEDYKKDVQELSARLAKLQKDQKRIAKKQIAVADLDKETSELYQRLIKKQQKFGSGLKIFSNVVKTAGTILTFVPGFQLYGAGLSAAGEMAGQASNAYTQGQVSRRAAKMQRTGQTNLATNQMYAQLGSELNQEGQAIQLELERLRELNRREGHLFSDPQDHIKNLHEDIEKIKKEMGKIERRRNKQEKKINNEKQALEKAKQEKNKLKHKRDRLRKEAEIKKREAKIKLLKKDRGTLIGNLKKKGEEKTQTEIALDKAKYVSSARQIERDILSTQIPANESDAEKLHREKIEEAIFQYHRNSRVWDESMASRDSMVKEALDSTSELIKVLAKMFGTEAQSQKVEKFAAVGSQLGHHGWEFAKLFLKIKDVFLPGIQVFLKEHAKDALTLFLAGKMSREALAAFVGLLLYHFAIPMMRGIVLLHGICTSLKDPEPTPIEKALQNTISLLNETLRLLNELKNTSNHTLEKVQKLYHNLNLIGDQVLTEIREYSKEILSLLNEANYNKQIGEVNTKVSDIEAGMVSHQSKLAKQEVSNKTARLEKFLTFITIVLKDAKEEVYRGFTIGNSNSLEGPKIYPSVHLVLLYRNPEYFTALLANHLQTSKTRQEPNVSVPNLVIFLKALEYFVRYIQDIRELHNIHQQTTIVNQIQGANKRLQTHILHLCQQFKTDAKEIENLYLLLPKFIDALIVARNRVSSETRERINSIRSTLKEPAQFRTGLMSIQNAVGQFKPAKDGKLPIVGSKKFFLHSLVNTDPMLAQLPMLNLQTIYNEKVHGSEAMATATKVAKAVRSWAAITALSFGIFTVEKIVMDTLKTATSTEPDWLWDKVERERQKNFDKRQRRIEFLKHFPLCLLHRLDPNEISFLESPGRWFLNFRTDSFNFDLAQRKFVWIRGDATHQQDLRIDIDTGASSRDRAICLDDPDDPDVYHETDVYPPEFNLHFQNKSPISSGELEKIPEPSDGMYSNANYDEEVGKLITSYIKLLQSFISGQDISPNETDGAFSSIKRQDCQLIPGIHDHLIPLVLPKQLIRECEKRLNPELYELEATESGTLIPYYDFSVKQRTLTLCFQYITHDRPEGQKYCRIDIAKFDSRTLRCFLTDLNSPESVSLTEFLIQALYTSFGNNLGLPGDETYETKAHFVAPKERSFPGLFRLWEFAPDSMIEYRSQNYSKAVHNNLISAMEEEHVDLIPEADPMFRPLTVQLDDDYLAVSLGYKHKKAKLASLETEFSKSFHAYIALVKLLSSFDNKTLYAMTERYFGITPEFIDQEIVKPVLPFSGQLPPVSQDVIDLFTDELKLMPSAKMTELRTRIRQIDEIEDYVAKKESTNGATPQAQSISKQMVGLPNIGNSCYINASLQVLLHSKFAKTIQACTIKNNFVETLKGLLEFVETKDEKGIQESLLLLRAHLTDSTNREFSEFPYEQKDAGAFLAEVLSQFNYVLKLEARRGGYANIGQHVSTVTEEIHNLLYLPLNGKSNKLEDLLFDDFYQFISPQGGVWTTEAGNQSVHVPNSSLIRRFKGTPPEILAVQLMRYKADPCEKIDTPVELTDDGVIDLSPYMVDKTKSPIKYGLCGCVDHHGSSLDSGHYTAYVKIANQWHYVNDDLLIKPVSFEEVKKSQHYIYLFEKSE